MQIYRFHIEKLADINGVFQFYNFKFKIESSKHIWTL
jgi:hypothetical protein